MNILSMVDTSEKNNECKSKAHCRRDSVKMPYVKH